MIEITTVSELTDLSCETQLENLYQYIVIFNLAFFMFITPCGKNIYQFLALTLLM